MIVCQTNHACMNNENTLQQAKRFKQLPFSYWLVYACSHLQIKSSTRFLLYVVTESMVATLYLGMTLFFFFFFNFWGFQESETPIEHAQNFNIIAELNSTPQNNPISVNN